MSLAKIGKQLRREALANPKKAVFLGLAVVVAAYFWTPLIWGWIGKKGNDVPAAAASSDATPVVAALGPAAVPQANDGSTAAVPAQLPWPQIAQQMHNDPRMTTSPPLTLARDPFESLKVEAADAEAASEKKSKLKPPAIRPSDAGLVLTGTIIGPQRRIAQISGRSYLVGQNIEAMKDNDTLGVTFKLVEVHARQALLEAGGQRYELTIPEPNRSSKIQFLGAAGGQ